MTMTRFLRHPLFRALIWGFIVLFPLEPLAVAAPLLQDDYAKMLKDSETKFNHGDFDASIAILKQCLKNKDFNGELRNKGYELLGQNYVALSYIEQARDAIRKLLELVPTYVPPSDDPGFKVQVDKVKEEIAKQQVQPVVPPSVASADSIKAKRDGRQEKRKEEAWYENTWVWIGGGVLVAGGVVLLVAGKKENGAITPPPVLPVPPVFPN